MCVQAQALSTCATGISCCVIILERLMKLTIFDTETTGLPKPSSAPLDKQPRICEIGALVFDTDTMSVVAECSQLINPGIPMPEDVIKIHHITDEMVADQPRFDQAFLGKDEFPTPIARLFTDVDYIVAHNAPFDVSLLQFEFDRLGLMYKLPQAICTVQEYKHLYGRRLKLTELYTHFTGKEYGHKHRAIDDTRALLEALIAARFFDSFIDGGNDCDALIEPILPLDDMLKTYEEP
jgi:DNA polymerase III epsilon subunit-like protein